MSEIKVNKISPRSGTGVTLGDSGDKFTVPSGSNITINSGASIVNDGTATGFGDTDTNDKVKVSTNDTTAGFLNGKLVAGTNISLTEGSDGGNETLTAAFSGNLNASVINAGTIATARLGSGTASSSTFLRGDQTYATPAGGTNTPAFQACRTTNQSISNNTFTKVAFQTQNFDITNVYDTDVYSRFTPGIAGKYYIYTQVQMGGLSADAFYISIYKNGATWLNIRNGTDTSGEYILTGAAVDTADSNDYYEVFAYQNSGGALNVIGYSDAAARIYTAFGAYKIIT